MKCFLELWEVHRPPFWLKSPVRRRLCRASIPLRDRLLRGEGDASQLLRQGGDTTDRKHRLQPLTSSGSFFAGIDSVSSGVQISTSRAVRNTRTFDSGGNADT